MACNRHLDDVRRRNHMLTSPEHRLTENPREVEQEVDHQTYGEERLRKQVTSGMKSKL